MIYLVTMMNGTKADLLSIRQLFQSNFSIISILVLWRELLVEHIRWYLSCSNSLASVSNPYLSSSWSSKLVSSYHHLQSWFIWLGSTPLSLPTAASMIQQTWFSPWIGSGQAILSCTLPGLDQAWALLCVYVFW